MNLASHNGQFFFFDLHTPAPSAKRHLLHIRQLLEVLECVVCRDPVTCSVPQLDLLEAARCTSRYTERRLT